MRDVAEPTALEMDVDLRVQDDRYPGEVPLLPHMVLGRRRAAAGLLQRLRLFHMVVVKSTAIAGLIELSTNDDTPLFHTRQIV